MQNLRIQSRNLIGVVSLKLLSNRHLAVVYSSGLLQIIESSFSYGRQSVISETNLLKYSDFEDIERVVNS